LIPWELIEQADIPKQSSRAGQGSEISSESKISLYRRGDEYSIRVDNWELMNSRAFSSEKEIASAACERITRRPADPDRSIPRVLIGGLGMGFTLRTALDNLPEESTVMVAELIPEVVEWNKKYLGKFAGEPLADPRVEVYMGDVADRIRSHSGSHDAIVLDVDNGPHAKPTDSEGWLYSHDGLDAIHNSLRPDGILTIWSAGPTAGFTQRVKRRGFDVEESRCRSRGDKGNWHVIWVAQRKEKKKRND